MIWYSIIITYYLARITHKLLYKLINITFSAAPLRFLISADLMRTLQHQSFSDCLCWLLFAIVVCWGSRLRYLWSWCRLVYLWQLGSNLFEKLLNICTCFCAHFIENNTVSLSQLSAFTFRNVPILQVNLVCQKCNNDTLPTLILDIINPFLYTFKRESVGDIIHNNCDWSISNVIGYECFKSLLSGGIPKL